MSLGFDVPPLDRLRFSTPILTDAVQVTAGGAPNTVLLARRTFHAAKRLFCRFDVYGAAADPATRMPRVVASHVLRHADGREIGRSDPTEIAPTSLGGISRLMQIPLGGLPAGDYELELLVRDEGTGQETRSVEPFTLLAS